MALNKLSQVGTDDVVFSQQLIIPDDKSAWVYFMIGLWKLKVNFRFEVDVKDTQSRVNITPEDDKAIVSLINWNDQLGMASMSETPFGSAEDGTDIYMALFNSKAGDMNLLQIQFTQSSKQ